MVNPIKILKWSIGRSLEDRAKYKAWKYNTFGPGREVYGRDYVYQIIDCGELQGKLYLNDSTWLTSVASIIAEMEGHKEIAFRGPRVMPQDKEKALKKIRREEDAAIDRVVQYIVPDNLQPQQYTEFYDNESVRDMWGMPGRIPVILVIEPNVPKYREDYRKMFRDMLEKLKQEYTRKVS